MQTASSFAPRLVAAGLVPIVLILGLWITGGRLTENFRVSMALTALWFALAAAAALLVSWRRRALAVPVLGAFLVSATAIGGYLAWTTLRDKVVDEPVAVASAGSGNVKLAAGRFQSDAHSTSGTAEVIRLAGGERKLVLDLETDAGPDLRVYLVPGDGSDSSNHRDLGGLKGNIGRQQYAVPANVDIARYRNVVIWCRAFSVLFGRAPLTPESGAS